MIIALFISASSMYLVGLFFVVFSISVSCYLVYRDDKRLARLQVHAERCKKHDEIMEANRIRKEKEALAAKKAFDSQIDVKTFYGDGR